MVMRSTRLFIASLAMRSAARVLVFHIFMTAVDESWCRRINSEDFDSLRRFLLLILKVLCRAVLPHLDPLAPRQRMEERIAIAGKTLSTLVRALQTTAVVLRTGAQTA